MAIENRDNYRNHQPPSVPATWTSREAYLLAAICLLAGLALGYLFHGSSSPVAAASVASTGAPGGAPVDSGGLSPQAQMPTADMVNQMAGSLLERLRSNPADGDALIQLGNLYMDHKQFTKAIEYYEKALKLDAKNVNVRTDMGTCYYYAGDPKRAIQEFHLVLNQDPTHAQTLFNMGVVEQEGLHDAKAAIAAWQKLLDTNPQYEQRDRVQQMIAQAKGQKG